MEATMFQLLKLLFSNQSLLKNLLCLCFLIFISLIEQENNDKNKVHQFKEQFISNTSIKTIKRSLASEAINFEATNKIFDYKYKISNDVNSVNVNLILKKYEEKKLQRYKMIINKYAINDSNAYYIVNFCPSLSVK